MNSAIKRGVALLLCLLLLAPAGAFAEGEEPIFDPEELQAMLDAYIAARGFNPDNISVGYVYTATGDTWYCNADKWYYSASMYKVPLMMILAEKEYNGELTRDSSLKGLTLGQAEELILTYSHNDYAHLMMSVVADTEPDCRELYKNYVDLPEDYYDPDFHDYSYFTARFMTQVMTTLFNQPERFPNVIDCLKLAQPEHYFRVTLGNHEIAQKYGSYEDYSARQWNHTTGIIYLPHPIILTVMTLNNPTPEQTIADIAKLFADYSLALDERLAQYEQEQEAPRLAAQAAEEEARRQEEERLAAETAALSAAVSETAEPDAAAPAPAAAQAADSGAPSAAPQTVRLYILGGAAALFVALLLLYRIGRRRA